VERLRERLATLRGQTGGAAETPGPEGAFRERLGALDRVRARPRRTVEAHAALARALGGRLAGEGLVAIEESLAFGSPHGRARLEAPLEALGFFAGGGAEPLFLDVETTGLSGGSGTLAFLVGVVRTLPAGLALRQYLLTGFAGERAMLAELRACASGTPTLVTYNGKSFDQPILAARCRLAGGADPLAGLDHLDLLHLVRRTFRARWPDCTLRTAERRLLGLERRGDLPGAEAPAAWFEWVRHGRAERLRQVVRHNRLDVLSLAAVLPALRRCYEHPIDSEADVCAIARHRARREGAGSAFACLLEARARLDRRGLLELARLARGRGLWALARDLWESLAASDDEEALECLAKYHEHVACDPERALGVAERLLLQRPRERHRRRVSRLRARRGRAVPRVEP